jgi:hypothetical protein
VDVGIADRSKLLDRLPLSSHTLGVVRLGAEDRPEDVVVVGSGVKAPGGERVVHVLDSPPLNGEADYQQAHAKALPGNPRQE